MVETKPGLNGVVRIARRSTKKFQFGGDDEPVVALDVIEVSDRWYELSSQHRVLDGDKLAVKAEKFNEYAQARLDFVQGVVNDAYAAQHKREAPVLDRAEAEEFLKHVTEATDELRNFIFGNDEGTSSLPASTEGEREINFSQ